jgi:hypothetical protein
MSFVEGGPGGTGSVLHSGFNRVPSVEVPDVAVAVLHRSTFLVFIFHVFTCLVGLDGGRGEIFFLPAQVCHICIENRCMYLFRFFAYIVDFTRIDKIYLNVQVR